MKIKKITEQHRRDFFGVMECEFCGATDKISGYDDRNFHDNVVPGLTCKNCNKSTVSGGGKADAVQTKYPDGLQV